MWQMSMRQMNSTNFYLDQIIHTPEYGASLRSQMPYTGAVAARLWLPVQQRQCHSTAQPDNSLVNKQQDGPIMLLYSLTIEVIDHIRSSVVLLTRPYRRYIS